MVFDTLAGIGDALGMRWRFRHADEEALARHRLAKLHALCTRLARASPFFRGYFAALDTRRMSIDEFDRLPVLDKRVMMERFDDWNTAGLSRSELVAFARENDRTRDYSRWFGGRWSVGLSSGTSGATGLAVYSRGEIARGVFRFLARTGLPRGLRAHRVMFALRTSAAGFAEIDRFGWILHHVDYRRPLPAVVDEVNRLRLNILAGSPTFLQQLACVAPSIDHPVDVVVSYAEILEPRTKAALAKAFNAPVHQIYACTEGYIATTCPHGTLHFNDDVMHIRLVPREGGPANCFHMIVTDILRSVQPIINYRLNDMIELDPTPCACGSRLRAVRGVLGRSDDALVITRADGASALLYADYVCRAIIEVAEGLSEYRVVQRDPGSVEVMLDVPPGATGTVNIVRTRLDRLFSEYTDRPPRLEVRVQEIAPDPDQKLKRVSREFPLPAGM
jgi:putative adenylate-forming enzyme